MNGEIYLKSISIAAKKGFIECFELHHYLKHIRLKLRTNYTAILNI